MSMQPTKAVGKGDRRNSRSRQALPSENSARPKVANAPTDWGHVDRHDSGSDYIEFLHTVGKLRPHGEVREALMRCIDAPPGVAADVGCGLGHTVRELAARGWRATGVDLSSTMVAEAKRQNPGQDFHVGSALALPLSDRALDLYCSQRVWMHLTPAQIGPALSEARRVLRRGGTIAIAEPDFETLVYPCGDAHRATARIARQTLVESFGNGHAGTFMRDWLHTAGFEAISVTHYVEQYSGTQLAIPLLVDLGLSLSVERGTVSAADVAALREDLARRERGGGFHAAVMGFITVARSPMG